MKRYQISRRLNLKKGSKDLSGIYQANNLRDLSDFVGFNYNELGYPEDHNEMMIKLHKRVYINFYEIKLIEG